MFTVIIPARYGSQRLPGKALIDIAGKPMIRHVFEQASKSAAASVVVATDDERIGEVVSAFGGEVVMTSGDHPSGTDRLHEAAGKIGLSGEDIVVNVQGDEPLVPPEVIDQVADNLARAQCEMATLFERIEAYGDVMDPNIVKVVTDEDGFALYFSRAPIPFDRAGHGRVMDIAYKRHLGIYGYRVSLLDRFVGWSPTVLEETEKLEQLRALSHGVRIHVAEAVVSIPPGIDTERDLERTLALFGESR